MIEKEIKILLTKSQYKQIEKLFTWHKDYVQTNYYYKDLGSDGKNSGPTIRIREKAEEFFLQVKSDVSEEGALHIKKEYEKKIDGVREVISSTELEELTGIKFKDVSCIGSLTTRRKECLTYEDIIICLDKSSYLDIKDYELEIEFTGEYPEFLVEKLKENDIYLKENVSGKRGRFTKRYNLIKSNE